MQNKYVIHSRAVKKLYYRGVPLSCVRLPWLLLCANSPRTGDFELLCGFSVIRNGNNLKSCMEA